MNKMFNNILAQMILSAVKRDNSDVILLNSELTNGKELEKVIEQIADAVDSTKRPCKGIVDSKCDYIGHCGMVCNKCGTIHDNKPKPKPADNGEVMYIPV